MSLVILDTNLVSALMPKVVATRTLLDVYRGELVGKRYAVSLQSVAELLQGAELASVRWALPLITHDRDFRALDFPSLQVVCHAPE